MEKVMKEYHKIQSVFKRDEKTHKFIMGDYSREEFKFLKNNKWVYTEKIDGTNIRIGWDGETVKIGGRTDNAQLHIDLIDELNRLFPVDKFRDIYPKAKMTLYGEGYGAGIQKGGKYRPDKSFVLFDVLINEFWLSRENVSDIAEKLSILTVPIIGSGTIFDMLDIVKTGMKSLWGDFIAEGIVARPEVELWARNGQRIITKVKHVDF
jgi:hypothetical protein